jgi:hypothetical protein
MSRILCLDQSLKDDCDMRKSLSTAGETQFADVAIAKSLASGSVKTQDTLKKCASLSQDRGVVCCRVIPDCAPEIVLSDGPACTFPVQKFVVLEAGDPATAGSNSTALTESRLGSAIIGAAAHRLALAVSACGESVAEAPSDPPALPVQLQIRACS